METIRLYHFLEVKWALENIRLKRLKLSEVENLNDPFELWCMKHEDAALRAQLRKWKQDAASLYTLICFSKEWSNPLLWSHYGDKHKGVCLGFDVRRECVKKINYTKKRIHLTPPFDEHTTSTLLFTKYDGWKYEQEWRCWARLEKRDENTKNCYRSFDEDIALKEVIAGPLCEVDPAILKDALGPNSSTVTLTKARLALKSFSVVSDLRGF